MGKSDRRERERGEGRQEGGSKIVIEKVNKPMNKTLRKEPKTPKRIPKSNEVTFFTHGIPERRSLEGS